MTFLLAATLVPLLRQVDWQEGSCPTNAAVREVADAALPPEGYRLDVRPDGVRIASSALAGDIPVSAIGQSWRTSGAIRSTARRWSPRSWK